VSQTKPYPLPIAGVDTLSSETALVKGAVRSAVNVDIGRAGRFKRRAGYTRRVAHPGLHSLFYAAQKGWTLVARDAELYRLDTDTYDLTPLAPLSSPDKLEYTEYNGNLYFANKTTLGWVPSDSSMARPVGVPVPLAPTLSPAPGGLLPGRYGVAITVVDDRGEEGGATELQIIDLPEGGGIRLSHLPQRLGWAISVYITSADGDVLRWAAQLPAVFPSYVVAETAQGGELDTQFLTPLPPGDIVRWHNGRLFTAKDGALRFSEALRPHLHDPAHGVIPFSGRITFVESVGDGLYVGDSRGVWFLSGTDPTKFEQRRVSTCRAVARSSIMVPPEHFPPKQVPAEAPVAVWLGTSGYVVGMPGGTTVELQPDRLRVPSGLTGRSVFLLREGRKQIVTPVNSTSTATFGTAVDSVIS
jgi:hypothetical protein